MDNVKEAFNRVKEDMDFLRYELEYLKEDLKRTRNQLNEMNLLLKKSIEKNPTDRQTDTSTHNFLDSTTPTHHSTHNFLLKPLKPKDIPISTGNEGVPTDRQTDKQTNQQTDKSSYNLEKQREINSIDDAAKMLDSLDSLKKEIRLKFKRLTDQEMAVFTTLYQLSSNEGYVDYKLIASTLNLSESSIRDYVGRLIKKGIPVEKTKINNKTIQLSISQNLKKIATLSTILKLREI